MKATKDQQWKAGIDRNELRKELEALNILINKYDLADTKDIVNMRLLLHSVQATRSKVQKYMFNETKSK